jgi:HD-GYP domain-containing protein (c-di-GMP phosphodiesterase class II)
MLNRSGETGDAYTAGHQRRVADLASAIASHRPYRPARGIDAALEEIEKNRGKLYDENVVDVCLILFNEKGYKFF